MFSSSLSYAAWRPRRQKTSPSKPTAVRPAARPPRAHTQTRNRAALRGPLLRGGRVRAACALNSRSVGEAHSSRRSPGRGRLRPWLRSREGPREKHGGARAGLERFPFPPPRTVPRGFSAVRGRPGPVMSKTAELGQQVWGKQARGPTSWKAPESLSWKDRGSNCLREAPGVSDARVCRDRHVRARPRDRHVRAAHADPTAGARP